MSGLENGRRNTLRYLTLMASIIVIYFVIIASFLMTWQLTQTLGIHMALLLCMLASLLVLTLGSRILWRLVHRLSQVS